MGAGWSGIAAARRLQEKGYSVTVLERADRVGGKCVTKTLEWEGRELAFDMGATVVALSFRKILQLGRQAGHATRGAIAYSMLENDGTIRELREHYLKGRGVRRLVPNLARYAVLTRRFYKAHIVKTGYAPDIAPRYQVPFAEFCRRERLEGILPVFELPLAAWGYGEPETLPTWYVMGQIDPMALGGLLLTVLIGRSKFVQTWELGYGQVLSDVVRRDAIDVRLNVSIERIRRTASTVEITTSEGTQSFDFLVLSSHEVGSSLEDKTEEEMAFLSQVQTRPYSTTLCRLSRCVDRKLIVESHLSRINAVKMVASQHQGCPIVVCYANVSDDATVEDVQSFLKRDLEHLGFGLEEIYETRLWPNYFPRFPDVEAYKTFASAQGQERTLWVGALNRFEFCEATAITATHLIDAHFEDRVKRREESWTFLKNLRLMLR